MPVIKTPKGFKIAVAKAGIRYAGRTDMALIHSETLSDFAGAYTTNKVCAANITLNRKKARSGKAQAIIVNSGNANACTGEQGELDTIETASLVADSLGIKTNHVQVSSTGVIGVAMPMPRLRKGVKTLVRDLGNATPDDAARAIMTTDKFPKLINETLTLGGKRGSIVAIAKGAGMIEPNMATMLSFIATDADIEKDLLKRILIKTVNNSFNKISVDGDTSTNDMVILISNGVSKVKISEESEDVKLFEEALLAISIDMAKAIVSDGEGASKLIAIEVKGGKIESEVNIIAQTIANSPLVKTAIYGSDANWGRIITAVGRSGVEFDPAKVEIKFGDMTILAPNYWHEFDEEEATAILSKDEVTISVDLNDGQACTTWWTCDFSEKYIEINASYRT